MLRRRLGRWRLRGGRARSLSPAEAARSMAHLERLRADMAEGPRAPLDARLAAGQVTPRRLGPDDGWVWEMPGMRAFAIAGVRAFTVPHEEPPAGG